MPDRPAWPANLELLPQGFLAPLYLGQGVDAEQLDSVLERGVRVLSERNGGQRGASG